jgi:hypothetical protein
VNPSAARLAALGPLRPGLTAREAASLHLAARLVVDVFEGQGKPVDAALIRGAAALESALTKAGCVLTDQGWGA